MSSAPGGSVEEIYVVVGYPLFSLIILVDITPSCCIGFGIEFEYKLVSVVEYTTMSTLQQRFGGRPAGDTREPGRPCCRYTEARATYGRYTGAGATYERYTGAGATYGINTTMTCPTSAGRLSEGLGGDKVRRVEDGKHQRRVSRGGGT